MAYPARAGDPSPIDMSADQIQTLSELKGLAADKHARDSANNPQIPDEKVPNSSAARKVQSATAEYASAVAGTSGLTTDQVLSQGPPRPFFSVSPASAHPNVALPAPASAPQVGELELVDRLRTQAETEEDLPNVMEHVGEAATKAQASRDQDQDWLRRHP